MLKLLNSDLGHLIARNGILAVILVYSLYVNHGLTERLFTVIENNTQALSEFKTAIKDLK